MGLEAIEFEGALLDFWMGAQGTLPIQPVEFEWKRKDNSVVKVRLSGREVLDEQNGLDAYEVIAKDITQQRELEDHPRRQAASDPLTGLANYRLLVE